MLATLFEQFLKEKQYLKGISPLTTRSYRQAFDRFTKSGATEVSKASLNQFVIYLWEKGLATTSCNISIRSINAFCTWLYENEHIPENLKLKQVKEEKRVLTGYTDEEIKKILSVKPEDLYDWRLYSLACLLIDTGIRIEEALTIHRKDVDLDNLLVKVKGKGNKERVVPISLELRRMLCRFLNKHPHDIVFATRSGQRLSYRNILREWEVLCRKLEIPYRPFHQLRHNFALSFIREGGDVFTLRRLLGHSSIQTTSIYVNLQTEDLKRAHAKTSILGRLK
ncbi:MAG: tyrosine-type recombinase/integrase [Blastocatellia bacterium]